MARNRYEIVLADGYGSELDRLVVQATNLRLALLVSEAALRRRRAGHGQEAVSASVELLGRLEDSPEPELHSVRHDLHPVRGVDMDTVARLEAWARSTQDERS
jgi:hypothetical protein